MHDNSRPMKDQATARRHADELQWTCRNFPRVHAWETDAVHVDCTSRTFTTTKNPTEKLPMAWDAHDDRSTAVYRPAEVDSFVIIMSNRNGVKQRDELRQSWLRKFDSGLKWDYGFFVGSEVKHQSASAVQMRGDIVELKATDAAEHVGIKVLGALQWTLANVKAKYLLKVDENTWVHTEGMTSWLQAHVDPSKAWYGGLLPQEGKKAVERTGKKAVPTNAFAASEYPQYAQSGGYVMTASAATRIFDAVQSGRSALLPNVEDVMIGLAATAENISAVSIDGFHKQPFEGFDKEAETLCCTPGTLLFHQPSNLRACDECHASARRALQAVSPSPPPFPPPFPPISCVDTWPVQYTRNCAWAESQGKCNDPWWGPRCVATCNAMCAPPSPPASPPPPPLDVVSDAWVTPTVGAYVATVELMSEWSLSFEMSWSGTSSSWTNMASWGSIASGYMFSLNAVPNSRKLRMDYYYMGSHYYYDSWAMSASGSSSIMIVMRSSYLYMYINGLLVNTGGLAVTAWSASSSTLDDSCNVALDGECDEGGPGAEYSLCTVGTDCACCSHRTRCWFPRLSCVCVRMMCPHRHRLPCRRRGGLLLLCFRAL